MTAKGIPAFTDKLGRQWSPEAYINMDIRTTCSNTAHKAQFDRMDAYGATLLEVSSHMGARPKCAKDQGRIFDRTNTSAKYRHWSSSSYGDPDGLLGINCRHKFYPFIEGVNTQTYFPYDEEENAKAYKLQQEQRQLERNVRSAKRECTAMDTLGDTEGFSKASAKLKNAQSNLKTFCSDNDLSYKSDRTSTPGYNKSISSKVVQSNKASLQKQIDNVNESDIIKESTFSSEELLNNHFTKHSSDYSNYSQSDYLNRARELLSSQVSETILGFTGTNEKVYRYDTQTGDFAVLNKSKTIATLFKPKQGIKYWEKQVKTNE